MIQISRVFYQTLIDNAPYRVREDLLRIATTTIDPGEARDAAQALVTIVRHQRGIPRGEQP